MGGPLMLLLRPLLLPLLHLPLLPMMTLLSLGGAHSWRGHTSSPRTRAHLALLVGSHVR
jgi:hypothetical protein